MFNKLFKSTSNGVVAETVKQIGEIELNRRIIEEIHNSFNNEGDRLLAEANEIIGRLTFNNEDKTSLLESLGFTATKEVQEKRSVEKQRAMHKTVVDAIMQAKMEYPLYKFITEESAKRIAEKYNLVLGTVSQYKGFVPHKNALEIEQFFKNHPNDRISYFKEFLSMWSTPTRVTKEEFLQNLRDKQKGYSSPYVSYTAGNTILNICAPLSDMNVEGHKLKDGWKLEKEVPDPIVMLEKEYKGVKGFIIITAWGDESSDEEVINQQLN